MKYLRPRSAKEGLSTVLLVSDAELARLIGCVAETLKGDLVQADQLALKKLCAELRTARGK